MASDISDRKAPGFWFFTADYERDMQMLPMAAQGLWMRMLCWMSDNEIHRGFLELPNGIPMVDQDIARRAGISVKETRRLMSCMERIGTFSRDERGCVLSRRMARDTHISVVRRNAAIKRATAVERAKTGEFAPAKSPAKPEQTPTVPESESVPVPVSVVVKPDDKNKNGFHKNLTTTDDRKYATDHDALVALIGRHTGRKPDVKLIRGITEQVELRGGTLAEYLTDIKPRIGRLRAPPREGFFRDHANKWGSAQTTEAPDPETLEEKQARIGPCPICRNVGMIDGAYCSCKMADDLRKADSRRKPPQQEAS